MPANATLANINLFVRDVPRSVQFYQEVVGLVLDDERSVLPDFALLRGGDSEGGATVTLQNAMETPGAGSGPAEGVEIGFAVDDVEAVRDRAEAFFGGDGGSPAPVQQMGWGTACDVRDPDNFRITLFKMRS